MDNLREKVKYEKVGQLLKHEDPFHGIYPVYDMYGSASKTKTKEPNIEIKDIEPVLKSVLPELKREKISRSESCI